MKVFDASGFVLSDEIMIYRDLKRDGGLNLSDDEVGYRQRVGKAVR